MEITLSFLSFGMFFFSLFSWKAWLPTQNINDSSRNDGWIRIPHGNEFAIKYRRIRRHIGAAGNVTRVPPILNIETAIFVDKDLYRHMVKNFPKNTEANLIRFVLAMINGVRELIDDLKRPEFVYWKYEFYFNFRSNYFTIIHLWGIRLTLYWSD